MQALKDYAPVTNVLALILLPIAIFPMQSDEFNNIASEHYLGWLRSAFLIAFIAQKVNDHVVYGHVGSQGLASYRSMDIWCAPCMSTHDFLHLLSIVDCHPNLQGTPLNLKLTIYPQILPLGVSYLFCLPLQAI